MTNQGLGRPFIGVTGTNGKTSTILMLQFVLEYCGLNPATMDMWRGGVSFQKLLNTATQQNKDCILAELPADVIRQNQVDATKLQVAALTNLSLDHLKSCRTPENYYAVKSRLFKNLSPQAKAVINADDHRSLSLSHEGTDFITYAIHYPHAMVVAENIRQRGNAQTFDLTVKADFTGLAKRVVPVGSHTVYLPIMGEHNIYNALLAGTLALLFQLDLEKIAESLSKFPGIRRNMEVINLNRLQIIDDAARNPAAIHAALTAAERLSPGRIQILHGIYGGGGEALNICNAKELAAHLHQYPNNRLFITRSMYHCKNKHQVRLSDEKAFLEELNRNNISSAYYPDLPDAVDSILSHAEKNDLILILGGPVLNRALELFLQVSGKTQPSHTIVPSEMTPSAPHPYAQTVLANPT